MKSDKQLFEILDKLSKAKYKKFEKYYKNDSKKFINRIKRDYLIYKRFPHIKENFPVHILKQIKMIPKKKYDSAVCILRGGIPYGILFEVCGWKVHYILCGRKNEQHISGDLSKLRINLSVDPTIKQVKNKKVLIVENNSPTGNTPFGAMRSLKEKLNIKKSDLFLDYYLHWVEKDIPSWLENPFWKNKKRLSMFGKIYIAQKIKVSKIESKELVREFLEKLK